MHPWGGARRNFSGVSLIDVRRTFYRVKDHGQDPTKRLLLTHHLQECSPFLHGVPTMPSSIKHLQVRWDANEAYPWGEDIRSMGNQLHGTFPTFRRERIYFGSSGLRLSPLGQTNIARCSNFLQGTSSLDTDVKGLSSVMEAYTSIMHNFMDFLKKYGVPFNNPLLDSF